MATRIKASASASASAMRRRIKRRSERASHKKKTNATLRSRKQRARKTARVMRKVMRGGEGEKTSEIFLESNTSVPTIKLKLSDKFMSKKKKLSIDINLELYNQDVRKLLCQLIVNARNLLFALLLNSFLLQVH